MHAPLWCFDTALLRLQPLWQRPCSPHECRCCSKAVRLSYSTLRLHSLVDRDPVVLTNAVACSTAMRSTCLAKLSRDLVNKVSPRCTSKTLPVNRSTFSYHWVVMHCCLRVGYTGFPLRRQNLWKGLQDGRSVTWHRSMVSVKAGSWKGWTAKNSTAFWASNRKIT